MILEELRSYANPKAKLSRMANQGECFRITRGLYETNKNTPGYLPVKVYKPFFPQKAENFRTQTGSL